MEKTIFATFVAVYFLALAACSGSKQAKNDVEQISYHRISTGISAWLHIWEKTANLLA